MNAKLNLGTKFHLDVNLYNDRVAHSNSKVSVHERNAEIPKRDIHSDSDAKGQNEEIRFEPRLSKYVKRHHPVDQIIGNKDARPIERNRLRSRLCLSRMK